MATARDLIERSLRLIHVLDPGEAMTASEGADSLESFNDLLDSWSLPGLHIFSVNEEALTWPASTQSRTIGSSGDFDTTRPTEILEGTYFRDTNSDDYPLEILRTRGAYNFIIDKDTTSSHPEYLYYEPSHALGTLYLWPAPSSAITLYLNTPQQFTQLASLDTTLSYPPGYKRALTYALAVELAGEFGVAVPPEVGMIAREAKAVIRRNNKKTPVARVETGWIGADRHYSIYGDR